MKWLFLTLSLLVFGGCDGQRTTGKTFQHGNVPNSTPSNNYNQPVIPIEEVTDPTTISFWTLYVPFLLIVLYITYKTFKPLGNTNTHK
tara:strand:- start:19 stop:282 length:264 start_codon:yes stop_codon:yes gene_type:complete